MNYEHMKRKRFFIIIVGLILSLLLISKICIFNHKKYNDSLNRIESIKYFEPTEKIYAYHRLTLTPTEYRSTPLKKTLVAKAIYKNDTIGLKIVCPRFGDKINFESIGKESDNFVKALFMLYEEEYDNSGMRLKIEGQAWKDGAESMDWNKDFVFFKIAVEGLDGKGAASNLDINIPDRRITIGDKNNGLSKQRFVNSFKN